MSDKIIIRSLSPLDSFLFAEATRALNRTQGDGLFPEDYLGGLVKSEKAKIFGAFSSEKLVGVAVAQIIDNFEYYLPFDSNICTELNGQQVGSFSTMTVIENLQGQGIGHALSKSRLSWIREQGCKVILGVSWVSGLDHTSNRVFEKMGFKPIRKVENFFKESSLEKPFDCPGCRSVPCTCAAILYRFELPLC